MALSTVYTCDVCGKQRGDTNHWFIAIPYMLGQGYDGVSIFPWGYLKEREDSVHLCGQGCAIKHLSEFLTEAK